MAEYIDETGGLTDDFRAALPEQLGDVYYNDPETRQQPTKELDNVQNIFDLAKMVVSGSRKISAHGDELKKATEGMVRIPGEGATPEDIAAWRKARGVPDTPDGYELTVPDRDGFAEVAAEVRKAAHELGVSPSHVTGLWNKVAPQLAAQAEALEKKGMELLTADVQALKDAKKENYDAFIADTNKVAAHFDIKGDAALGTKDNLIGTEFMRLMETLGVRDTPVVREFLGAIGPLVIEGKTAIGAGEAAPVPGGAFSYEYDENGKPI